MYGRYQDKPSILTRMTALLLIAMIVVCCTVLVRVASAQILPPPVVTWVGPETDDPDGDGPLQACDYESIQVAIADNFGVECDPIFGCPIIPGRRVVRLSDNYFNVGPIGINQSFDIVGGFERCGSNGNQPATLKTLGNAGTGNSLLVVNTGSNDVDNVLKNLRLVGVNPGPLEGGVVHMLGNATLTLDNSAVDFGRAEVGGGIRLEGNGNKLILKGAVVENSTAKFGGGISCSDSGVIDFQSGQVRNNIAELQGGGLHLDSGCELIGKTPNVDRFIIDNSIHDMQRGQGAGVFALNSTVELGTLLSRTRIERNIIPTFEPTGMLDGQNHLIYDHYNYDEPGRNRGGGVFADYSSLEFVNTWFRGNEAADGGAVYTAGNSSLLMDRSVGPCQVSEEASDCSLLEFNRARGGIDSEGDEGGDGAAVVAVTGSVRRTTIRFNAASCFESPEKGGDAAFTGECDLGGDFIPQSSTSILFFGSVGKTSQLSGNLIYGNSIGDHDDCDFFSCRKSGVHLRVFGAPAVENTITQNESADAVLDRNNLYNNIVTESEVDKLNNTGGPDIASCNLTNFADEIALSGAAIPIPNVDLDPLFANPGPLDDPSNSFDLMNPESPAIDRCDDADGLVTSTYDILGNPRPVNVPGPTNGPDHLDAGAFEAMPEGFVNETADLSTKITSDLPRTAELAEAHPFVIKVTNTGRNPVSELSVLVEFDTTDGSLETLSGAIGFDGDGNVESRWDCDDTTRMCTRMGPPLAVGSSTTAVTAKIAYQSEGTKEVSALVSMDDTDLTELEPANDQDADFVTVGPGANLAIILTARSTGEIPVGGTQTYGVTVINSGPELAEQPTVSFVLDPAAVIEGFVAESDWQCAVASRSCTLTTSLEVSQVRGFEIDVGYSSAGSKSLSASVVAMSPGDPELNNNEATAEILVLAERLFSNSFEALPTR